MNDEIVIANITVKGEWDLGESDKHFTLDTGIPIQDFDLYPYSKIREIRKKITMLFTFIYERSVGVVFSNERQY